MFREASDSLPFSHLVLIVSHFPIVTMWGVIPFLVQWAALTYFVTKQQENSYSHFPLTNGPIYQQPADHSIGHYTLLSEFDSLREEEIETFLPQIMNIILDRDALSDPHVIDHLEKIIIRKCSKCFPFGLRVFGALRVSKLITFIDMPICDSKVRHLLVGGS